MKLLFGRRSALVATAVTATVLATSCSRPSPPRVAVDANLSEPANAPGAISANLRDPCELALAPHQGESGRDREIARQQANVRNQKHPLQALERLGWLYVAKARETFDPGFYKLAEQCALCLDSRQPHSADALLLRGHVLQNLHRFKEAEALARQLVVQRGRSFDFGLFGDTLMEQGKLDEAVPAYQRMVDEKPDLQAYARIAHLRWLKGDVAGAAAIMQLATSAASPAAPEAAAWVNTRLALLQFQQGHLAQAAQTCRVALDYHAEYAPTWLLRGRLLLAEGRTGEAVEALQHAARLNPLPEYQWVLSEALHAADENQEAAAVETSLVQQGASCDPRTLALYLASRGESLATALQLARAELETRGDVFTHDALAWALAMNGQVQAARPEMRLALSQGTNDPRLFLHAAIIAAQAGEPSEALGWLAKAEPMLPLLLPSEQQLWRRASLELGHGSLANASACPATIPLRFPAN
jgi:tetratricopeptide (TPR) repeat protein